MIHMTIVSCGRLVADLPKWDGPVPQKGDFIFQPPYESSGPDAVGSEPLQNNTAGQVRTVQWRTHDRTPEGNFTQTAHPYVEITI